MTAAATEKRGLLLAFAVFGLFWGAYASLLPAVKQQTGLSDGRLGVVMGAIALAALPSMPLAGRLTDRFGAARLARYALVAFGLVTPLPALAHGAVGLVAAFVLIGLTTGFLDVVINAATATWERIEAARLMAGCHGLFSAGMLVGGVATGFVRNAGGGPGVVLPVVAACVIAVGVTQPAYRRSEREHSDAPRRRLGAVLLLIGGLVALSFLLEDALQSWSALHIERDLHARPWVSGLGPGLFAAAMTAGRLGSQVFGARHAEGVVVAAGGSCVAAGALLLAAAPTPPLALAGVVLAGAGCSVLAPTLFSAVGTRSAAGHEGAALGAVSTLGYGGFLVGPPVIGLLSAVTSLPTALGLLGLLGIGIAVGGPLVLRQPVPAGGNR